MTNENGMWSGRRVLVTGGTSFIGSNLVDQLVNRGAKVRIVDDLSSGRLENVQGHLASGAAEFVEADLREPGVTRMAMQGVQTVFHLAADHGGRGYVDLHQAGPASNFFLDGLIFAEAVKAGVEKVVFASSGCVYPNFLQSDTHKEVYLTEGLTKGPNDADNTYGWAKLMGGVHSASVCARRKAEVRVVPLFYGVWAARRGEPCCHRHDSAGLHRAESFRSMG